MCEPSNQDVRDRLDQIGKELALEQDPDRLLHQILEQARASTGARYAALGVLDEKRVELERFLTAGIDPATARAIGAPPRGRGLLGLLVVDPRPMRVADVRRHPESYGFPEAHPAMSSFLGVPILINDQAWGSLYVAEKSGGVKFTVADEEAAALLAGWAATAIVRARA